MLSSLVRCRPKVESQTPETEDIFQFALGTIFPDDLQNQHGDPGTIVTYRSKGYGDLEFEVADPVGEEDRTKFAHYLWNAGVLMGELVGGRRGTSRPEENEANGHVSETSNGTSDEEEWGHRHFADGMKWWLTPQEQVAWSVQGHRVLELGAGRQSTYSNIFSPGLRAWIH
jgi:EEF1A N-terminal glycine/lysine methyltransferase